jgi:hypothetical protein
VIKSRLWARVTVIVLTVLVSLSGCGWRAGMSPTLNEQQATDRVQQHIDDTVAIIQPTPRLERQSFVASRPCDLPSDNGPLGRITVGHIYWLREVPVERNAEVFATVERYWVNNGWLVLADDTSSEAPFLSVENREDSFRMSLSSSIDGQLSIGASSPCIWPNGTPEPQER